MTHLEYKGYSGSIEFSPENGVLFGKVLGIKGLISYEGVTGPQLEQDFKKAVDDYLETCKEVGITAEKPFKGGFNVRLPSSLHKKAALLAMSKKMSLNSLVVEAIQAKVN